MPSKSSLDFIHLRVRSEFSIVKGLAKVDDLVRQAAKLRMPALALADKDNLYAAIKFHKTCCKRGIKPIFACELTVQPENLPAGPMLFLVRNQEGYRNLLKLVSEAHLKPLEDGSHLVHESQFAVYGKGLLVLSGGRHSTLGQLLGAGKAEAAADWLNRCSDHWPNSFYIELQRTGHDGEEAYIQQAVQLASEHSMPVVATHDVCFLQRQDFGAHEARVCIQEGVVLSDPNRSRHYTEEQYMKSPKEMRKLFDDCPSALANSVEIARRCSFSFSNDTYLLPSYQDETGQSEEEILKKLTHSKLELRCQALLAQSKEQRERYLQRLEFELGVIVDMGFAGYFLIVMEFVDWAKHNRVPVGPARGSGAGSLVAYVLGITDLDPIKYGLLFERFLNPERKSMPDIDIDFCIDGRDRVIDHVVERYGKDTVSQIITFNTMAARAAIRDVARVLGKPYGLGDRLAKMIPHSPDATLKGSLSKDKELRDLRDNDPEAAEILDMALELEGCVRSCGKHPGGVVIAPGALNDYVPLTLDDSGENTLIQFDKDDAESVGLVKFDFLGLRTLTIIDRAVNLINERHSDGEQKLAIDQIPLDDPAVFDQLKKADTQGVFQLESRGMRQLIGQLKPSEFEDMAALVALYRPGPLGSGMSEEFAKRKHGKKISLLDARLEPILKKTYGVIVYQEQVMEIARRLGGYSLGDADTLRRAMGKKDHEEMQQQQDKFVAGAVQNGIHKEVAEKIFELMLEFAGYGFNRSHSVGYALIAWQTAWLKCHYPAEFMAATLSAEMQDTDRVAKLLLACSAMGLEVSSPDVNQSQRHFVVPENKSILYGLGGIKGVGTGAANDLAKEAGLSPYKDLFDLCSRQIGQRSNKKSMEALIKSGALDSLPLQAGSNVPETRVHRATLLAHLGQTTHLADQQQRNRNEGLVDLFAEEDMFDASQVQIKSVTPWSDRQLLDAEYEALGLYLSSHPIRLYSQETGHARVTPIAQLKFGDGLQLRKRSSGSKAAKGKGKRKAASGDYKTIAGLVVDLRKQWTKKGNRMAFALLEDDSGRIEITIGTELLEECQWLKEKQVVFLTGEMEADDYTDDVRMRATSLRSTEMVRADAGVYLVLNEDQDSNGNLNQLEQLLRKHRGHGCRLGIHYCSKQAVADLTLGSRWAIQPTDDCLYDLKAVFGDRVRLGLPEDHRAETS